MHLKGYNKIIYPYWVPVNDFLQDEVTVGNQQAPLRFKYIQLCYIQKSFSV